MFFRPIATLLCLLSSFPSAEADRWEAISLSESAWTTAYDGYGSVGYSSSGISMVPAVPLLASETHAALALSRSSLPASYKVRITYQNGLSLRKPTANSWEVFWVFFDYQDGDDGKKQTNYFVLKPNGYELGVAYNEIEQRFLRTGPEPASIQGKSHELIIERTPGRVVITVDGIRAIEFQDSPGQAQLFATGRLGLYVEDAEATISEVSVSYQL